MSQSHHSKLKPRRQPQQGRSKDRVQLILESTRSILATEGVTAVTTPNIAAHARIPVSSIYQYFPNKKAIFAALYENYLEDIRATFGKFDDPRYLQLEWREFFAQLFKSILQQEAKDNLYRELEKAFSLYPELLERDRAHSEMVSEILADYMKKLGSRLTSPKRLRMARFLYCLNIGVWEYRSNWDSPAGEAQRWEAASVFAVLKEAFEPSPTQNRS